MLFRQRAKTARLIVVEDRRDDALGFVDHLQQVDVLRGVHEEIRERQMEKRYVALMHGHLPARLTSISAALASDREQGAEKRARVKSDGKASQTLVENVEPVGPHSLVSLRLVTGRMHQIRAHAQHIGHPVAGDRLYGDPDFDAELAALGLERLFLHASSLAFEADGRRLAVSAPLPPALADVLDRLRTSA